MTDDTKEVWRVEIRLKFARSFRLKTSNVNKCLLESYLLTLREEIFVGRKRCKRNHSGIYFCDFTFFCKI